ncbi:MAG: Ig-like domain-containing protein [Candidatus Nezhaarchaeales archaeon]
MPLISGSVLLEGEEVGAVSGEYIDESQDAPSENIQSRSIAGEVYLDGLRVDIAVTLAYDDYVTYNGGGTRTIDISGTVYLTYDGGNYIIAGNASGSLKDDYGAVAVIETQLKLEVTPHINGTLKYTLKATLTDINGNALQAKLINFFKYTDPDVKELIGQAETDEQGVAQIEFETSEATYVIAYFAGDDNYASAWSNAVYIDPSVDYYNLTVGRWMAWFEQLTNILMTVLMVSLFVSIISLFAGEKKEKRKG